MNLIELAITDQGLLGEASLDLISEKYDIGIFVNDHGQEPFYQRKLQDLQKSYGAVRKTRADGSCFYRAFGFAYLEFLLGKQQELIRFKEVVIQSKDELLTAGFMEHIIKHYYETFLGIIELVERDGTIAKLVKAFNHQYCSDSAVQYLRLVASAFLRNRADFYQPFIDESMHILDFCTQNVEPMATECDHVQITALTQALEIPLQVEYMDDMDSAINHHIFPEGASPSIFMLYRHNHYSILYRAECHESEDL
ncbi:ubiquitin thioesterase OTUB2 [Pelodytes ibericus]